MCSLHFRESDFLTETKTTQGPIQRRILTAMAIPSIFPNLPHYLSKPETEARTAAATSTVRRQNAIKKAEDEANKFLEADNIHSLTELRIKFDRSSLNSSIFEFSDQVRSNILNNFKINN